MRDPVDQRLDDQQAEIERLREGSTLRENLRLLAEIERLVSRNRQLEVASLQRDTRLRMEQDTNHAHCQTRITLESEIERLTAEKAEYHGKAAALLMENERLRAALVAVRDLIIEPGLDKFVGDKYLDVAREIAREALRPADET